MLYVVWGGFWALLGPGIGHRCSDQQTVPCNSGTSDLGVSLASLSDILACFDMPVVKNG